MWLSFIQITACRLFVSRQFLDRCYLTDNWILSHTLQWYFNHFRVRYFIWIHVKNGCHLVLPSLLKVNLYSSYNIIQPHINTYTCRKRLRGYRFWTYIPLWTHFNAWIRWSASDGEKIQYMWTRASFLPSSLWYFVSYSRENIPALPHVMRHCCMSIPNYRVALKCQMCRF